MKYIKYLLGIIGLLVGWIFVERGKKNSAEALNENIVTKEKVQALEGQTLQNDAEIKAEEQKRKDANDQAAAEKAKPVGDADIIDFFNKQK